MGCIPRRRLMLRRSHGRWRRIRGTGRIARLHRRLAEGGRGWCVVVLRPQGHRPVGSAWMSRRRRWLGIRSFRSSPWRWRQRRCRIVVGRTHGRADVAIPGSVAKTSRAARRPPLITPTRLKRSVTGPCSTYDSPVTATDARQGGPTAAEFAAMSIALEEAKAALAHGDVPIGAAVLLGGDIVARRHNERELSGDPTAHAEVLVLRDAARAVGSWRLDGATLVVTVEPCPMCAGAAVASRLGRLVFGAPDLKGGACGSLYNLCSDPRLNHEVALVGGVLAGEAAAMLEGFFRGLRQA